MSNAHFIEPMPCLAVKKLPEGEAWQYELKLDGYRALAVKREGRVTLFSRNGKRFDGRFPAIAAAFAKLPNETIIDGEIVAIDESGRPSFSRLQNFSANTDAITFYAFDMPMWKGKDLRAQPLDKRRELLRTKAMPKVPAIHFSDSFAADAEKMISAVRAQGLEGIVAKRRDSLYESGGRSGAWVKMRIGGGQEFVIGGYTPSPKSFDAVLVGYFDGGKLMFAARVRNGFVPTSRPGSNCRRTCSLSAIQVPPKHMRQRNGSGYNSRSGIGSGTRNRSSRRARTLLPGCSDCFLLRPVEIARFAFSIPCRPEGTPVKLLSTEQTGSLRSVPARGGPERDRSKVLKEKLDLSAKESVPGFGPAHVVKILRQK